MDAKVKALLTDVDRIVRDDPTSPTIAWAINLAYEIGVTQGRVDGAQLLADSLKPKDKAIERVRT